MYFGAEILKQELKNVLKLWVRDFVRVDLSLPADFGQDVAVLIYMLPNDAPVLVGSDVGYLPDSQQGLAPAFNWL